MEANAFAERIRRLPSGVNGVSEHLFRDGLCLPSGSSLSIDDQQRVIDQILSMSN